VTDLAPGDYSLKVEVNAGRNFQETDYTNNTVTTTVTVPDPSAPPDLVVDQPMMASTWSIDKRLFRPGSLAIKDGCVGDYGYRRLLIFTGQVDNIGQGDFFLGDPDDSPAFEYVPLHLHHHLNDFMQYQLLTPQGAPATAPRSQKFWFPFDWSPYLADPSVRPQAFYRKGNYGLQRGWLNFTFTTSVDCQWVDVTDVPIGLYTLSATVNPVHAYTESDFSNNTSTVAVNVNEPLSWIPHRPDGHDVPGIPLRVEPDPAGLRIDYDTGTCPAQGYNLYYSIQPPSEYTYNGAVCDLGSQSSAVVSLPTPAPGSMVWFTVVGTGGTREGGHGFDSAGRERPLTGAGMCGITQTLPRKSCSP